MQKGVREGLLVIVDDQSPPGSWQREIDLMPWKFSTPHEERIRMALVELRQRGLSDIANLLEQEIVSLRAK